MEEKSNNKTSRFNLRFELRATFDDRAKITALAKCLNVNESEAIRRAVAYSLATMPKTANVKR